MKNSDDSGYTGKHVGVCVLDTGIFPHIDFTGRILAFQDFIGHRIRPYDVFGQFVLDHREVVLSVAEHPAGHRFMGRCVSPQ